MSIRKYWLIVVAFVMILSLTSCNSNNEPQIVLNRPTGLSCSVPTYDNGATIRWNAVPSATGYIIYINDVEVDRTNKNAYAFTYEDSDIFCGNNCTVQAFDDNGGISLVSNILIIPNKAPITVNEINFHFNVSKNIDNTMLIEWQDVNAVKYEIYIGNEKIYETTKLSYLLTAEEVFNYNGQKISVKVIEDNIKIDYIPCEYEILSNVLIEAPVIKDSNDEEGNFVIKWGEVEGAVSYNVYIDGAQYAYNITDLEYIFDVNSNYTGCEIAVRAVDIYGRTSVFSNYCIYKTALVKPILEVTHLENEDILVTWNEVKYASKYKLYWRNKFVTEEYTEIILDQNEYLLSKTEVIKDSEMIEIYVEAIDALEENIETSETYFWQKTMETPHIYLGYEKGNFVVVSWYEVTDAVKYDVYVNGKYYKTETSLSCEISTTVLNENKKDEIYIIAISKQGTKSESSNIYVFE